MAKRTRCTYSYTIEDGILCIVDHDVGMSVTNDVENVIAEIGEREDLSKLPIIYRDTDERWDGLIVKDGRFLDFKPLGCLNKEIAKRAVVARRRS